MVSTKHLTHGHTERKVRITIQPALYDTFPIYAALSEEELKTIFKRALNTWDSIPKHILELSDEIEKM